MPPFPKLRTNDPKPAFIAAMPPPMPCIEANAAFEAEVKRLTLLVATAVVAVVLLSARFVDDKLLLNVSADRP